MNMLNDGSMKSKHGMEVVAILPFAQSDKHMQVVYQVASEQAGIAALKASDLTSELKEANILTLQTSFIKATSL
jgi:hypothetical protein